MLIPHGAADGGFTQTISEPGNPSSIGCSMQTHVNAGGGQMFQQQAYPGPRPFSDHSPYTDGAMSRPMPCLYQNYQQGALPHSQFGDKQHAEPPPAPPGPERESVDAIYRAVVDAATKGVHVTITTTVGGTTQAGPAPALGSMSSFTASIGEHRQVRQGRGQKSADPGQRTPDAVEPDYFCSPGRGTPRQWEGDPSNAAWGDEEFLECSTHVRSSPCMERPVTLAPPPPCHMDAVEHSLTAAPDKAFLDDSYRFNPCPRAPANYKERLEQTVERCVHVNGATPLYNARSYGDALLTGDEQSPGSSTSLEGPLPKDYAHYNGHFSGTAPSPSDTKSLSSEEDLRQPDSPSSELLHYRSRTFNMGELVWGPLKSFPPWPAKLAGDESMHHSGVQRREAAKVEPDKLKTLTHDLEALDRVAKRGLKPGKLNNHLEAAIHEAMSELDKMSANIPSSRDRSVKLPKPKRRKISR